MAAHPEEVARHRGQRIAVDPTRGIIASGATLGEVLAELDRLGVPDDAAVIVALPDQ